MKLLIVLVFVSLAGVAGFARVPTEKESTEPRGGITDYINDHIVRTQRCNKRCLREKLEALEAHVDNGLQMLGCLLYTSPSPRDS